MMYKFHRQQTNGANVCIIFSNQNTQFNTIFTTAESVSDAVNDARKMYESRMNEQVNYTRTFYGCTVYYATKGYIDNEAWFEPVAQIGIFYIKPSCR